MNKKWKTAWGWQVRQEGTDITSVLRKMFCKSAGLALKVTDWNTRANMQGQLSHFLLYLSQVQQDTYWVVNQQRAQKDKGPVLSTFTWKCLAALPRPPPLASWSVLYWGRVFGRVWSLLYPVMLCELWVGHFHHIHTVVTETDLKGLSFFIHRTGELNWVPLQLGDLLGYQSQKTR